VGGVRSLAHGGTLGFCGLSINANFGLGRGFESKLQAPTSKLQRSSNFQAADGTLFALELEVSLVLGAWDLVLFHRCSG
jgi:hypothetical protein